MRKVRLAAVVVIAAVSSVVVAVPSSAANSSPTIRVSPSVVSVGQRVTIKLHVHFALTWRVQVTLQKLTAKGWRPVGKPRKLAADSYEWDYEFASVMTAPGLTRLRVKYGGVPSNVRTVRVYRWHYLSSLTPTAPGALHPGSRFIGGRHFPHTESGNVSSGVRSAASQWALRRKCSTFDARLGLTGKSASDAHARLSIRSDGKSLFSAPFARGLHTPSRPTTDISGRRMLTLSGRWLSGGTATVGFGNARIRCLW